MKKLYKGKVHPSSPSPPSPPSPPSVADRLSLLPATILTLTIALSPQDREVLVYLISCACVASKTPAFSIGEYACGGGSGGGDHSTKFDCNCFRCYMGYWVRWDKSPNRQLIHEILEVYEDGIFNNQKKKKNKKKRNGKMKNDKGKRVFHALDNTESMSGIDLAESKRSDRRHDFAATKVAATATEEQDKTGRVRKIMSFIGEKIWGIWGGVKNFNG